MSPSPQNLAARTIPQWVGLIGGAVAALSIFLAQPHPEVTQEGWVVAALGALMVVWWVTEAVPIPATSLLPLVILPLFGVAPLGQVSASYMSPIVVLLMAGFIIAKAVERWGLHERIALLIVDSIGAKGPALIAGFMLSAALLSMWISNTATALMMTPIALSVARSLAGGGALDLRFTTALLLSIAYACSIGGLGTPVGTPTNLIVIGYLEDQGVSVSFAEWMRLGLPVVIVLLPLAWGALTLYAAGGGAKAVDTAAVRRTVKDARAALGRATAPELRTLVVFAFIAGAWIFRSQLQTLPGLERLNDQIIAVAGAILFFIIPSGASASRGAPLLDWRTAESIPWGVVLLFGGGLSLAAAISKTGLAAIMAGQFVGLTGLPDFFLILILVVFVLMMTEFTSNVATVSALMPMVGALAAATGVDPLLLAAPVGLAGSCAFMLPMATGPNAVVYAAGGVSLTRMAIVGVRVNILAALVISAVIVILAPQAG